MFRKPRATATAETATAESSTTQPAGSILDEYVRDAPTPQHAIDIFAGEWSSQFPAALGLVAGQVPLFEDPRISWTIEHLGGVDDFDVLELGPLEAGHTSMLQQAGARVLAIESNTRAFLKCLVVKELLELDRCKFVLGDFAPYLRDTDAHFDLLVASGVLYHSPDPLEMLETMARVADRVAIWTHYFEPTVVAADPEKQRRFTTTPEVVDFRGRSVTLHRRAYLESLEWTGFCGGPETTALWMERDDLLAVLGDLGYSKIVQMYDDLTNPNGACIMLCAERA